MAVIRPPLPTDGFTIISNSWLRDSRLSMRAKGLLAYILTHTSGHRLTTEQMVAESTDGRDAIRAGLNELQLAGYLIRQQHRGDGGKIVSVDFILQEPSDGSAGAGFSGAGPDLQKQDVSAGETSDGFSGAGESHSKKTTSKKTEKTTEKAPPSRGTRLPKDFQPDEAMRAWFVAEGLGRIIDGRVEHDKFVDYWTGRAAGGTKLDWPATWRNWMRKAAQDAGRHGRVPVQRPAYRTAAEKTADKNDRERVKSRIFDEIVKQEGSDLTKIQVVQEVSRRADAILDQLVLDGMTTCRPSGYTGPDRQIVDAVWYEGSPPRGEVTAA